MPPSADPRLLDPATGDSADGRYWCSVERGSFWYGDDTPDEDDEDPAHDGEDTTDDANSEGDAGDSKDDAVDPGGQESKLQLVALGYDFKIARYPVTNAEFARFIATGGYEREEWWTKNGWKARSKYGWTQPRYWADPDLNNPLQPVVGVSWYEAAAYCIWLTKQGHHEGWLPAEAEIRLPISLEWERAARHTDKRRYPWGDDPPTPERANYENTAIEYTSPIGCFPGGAAVCGAEDIVGNVWEWLATLWEEREQIDPRKDFTTNEWVTCYNGAFNDDSEYLCCGSRVWYFPGNWSLYLGFRVMWSLRAH